MQVFGVDVWNGGNSAVQNFLQGRGRNITFPIGLKAGGLYGLDRHSVVIMAGDKIIEFISPQSTPYQQRLDKHEAEMIAKLEELIAITGVEELAKQIPEFFKLHQNNPNPFTTATTIAFELSSGTTEQVTRLSIYNILGQEIRTIVQGRLTSGTHSFNWDGRDAKANQVPGGIYFYILESGNLRQAKRLLYLPQ